ncbi:hypothetical protein CHLNCDRAFT_143333 [Chlorella variabilis]|uniref:Very-long-chain (3R)-3-hydroxyacyl-CoA dehydratase n=1 Tax=Chlorella variabilis TaxID=554065 RepID=E1Z9Z9_CHLVA|nr:hypothetical protein CHLNCDRAFT_143333 [Chlorella variabilis]EFN57865.1 hypothetical protein CHLNCDRAFT_143333 [Chlorella variabilis]|eukprot:XP_005849967.1 hypothetical protein CHLNCDRAFT_143333 [Chlorella variabilis]
MGVKSAYLFLYNTALCAAWAYVLVLTTRHSKTKGSNQERWDSIDTVWQAVEVPLKVAQTAAVMEVVHSAVGLVRSPVLITATQVASRLFVLWGVVDLVPEAHRRPLVLAQWGQTYLELSLLSLLVAWCCSEIIRYSFFAFKELGMQPYVLLWLRYTAFIVLYPLGVSSELAEMPNKFNFAFDYYWACWLVVLLYLPGFPQLYFYMLAQRRKVLRVGRISSSAKLKAQ